jgi:anti-sigma factor RsiW
MIDHPIPCIDVIHQLWDYLDDELSADRAEGIASHLAMCAGCNAVSDFEIAFRDTARRLLREPSSVDDIEEAALHARVVAALEAKGFQRQARR